MYRICVLFYLSRPVVYVITPSFTLLTFSLFFFYLLVHHLDLPSFPTRRSSDLAESSILKIKGTEIQQAIQTLMMDVAGAFGGMLNAEQNSPDAVHSFGHRARERYMYGRASTIYGGSNEVQKNIIAKAILGL